MFAIGVRGLRLRLPGYSHGDPGTAIWLYMGNIPDSFARIAISHANDDVLLLLTAHMPVRTTIQRHTP
jgi:hypothetical protein